MYIDIFVDEPSNERPHVHISRTARHSKRSLKLWLDSMKWDETRPIDRYTPRELREIRAYIARVRDICLARWHALHGHKGRKKKR